ncbi:MULTISPECIES: flavin monoamine oxidase family protein [Arenibacter]|uniref:flavin monoamine oxidase family protein n=1 Tax=Arenibacter TaxID=178469 RepID=UPI001EFCF847|nr:MULTISPECIES: NAD(P)/FAD-dependent oxidoreductase [Arenibacter]
MSQLKRRTFMKNMVTAGVGATVLPISSLNANNIEEELASDWTKPSATSKKIIIGGAGIGGLCCAYELMKKGHEVVVLEASGRHGGHVYTTRDELSDGLYGDFGQEHIVKPGYERYWAYLEEFNITALPYPRRKNLKRRINGKFYTEQMLQDPALLKGFGFNKREISYLSTHPWSDLKLLYTKPYLDAFIDEYQPFNVGYDALDNIPMSDIYKKEGASPAALGFLGGNNSSALYELWYAAILKMRGVATYPTEVFRLKGGNQMLPNAFAKKLGSRVWLNCPISAITNGETGVTVTYERQKEVKEITGDYFVNCIPLPTLKNIPIQPALTDKKQYINENITYDSYQRFVFQASSKFWEDDGFKDINMSLDHPDLWEVWQSAEEVDTHRVIVLGTGPGGVSPQRALAAFREVYPGKGDSIELAVGRDWTKQKYSPNCERTAFPIGALSKFWPHIIEPEGRIHFAGAYADNLNWGTEAATRSANRVAETIDKL